MRLHFVNSAFAQEGHINDNYCVIQITAFQKIKHMQEVYFTIIKDIKLQFKNSAKRLLFVEKRSVHIPGRMRPAFIPMYLVSIRPSTTAENYCSQTKPIFQTRSTGRPCHTTTSNVAGIYLREERLMN